MESGVRLVSSETVSVEPEFSADALAEQSGRITLVTTIRQLSDRDWREIGRFLEANPQAGLSVGGARVDGFSFLEHMPWLRELRLLGIHDLTETTLAGLEHLGRASLRSFSLIGGGERVDIRPLARFENLRDLHLDSVRTRYEQIGDLVSLRSLSLRSVKGRSLQPLTSLRNLQILSLGFAGPSDFEQIGRIGTIRLFEFGGKQKVEDLGFLKDLPALECLELYWLRRVRELPELSGCDRLRLVSLDAMNGLKSVRALLSLPALESLIIRSESLRAEDLACLCRHATLVEVLAFLRSKEQTDRAHELCDRFRDGLRPETQAWVRERLRELIDS